MLEPLGSVVNDYGSLLELRDKLGTLSNTNPLVAATLLFIMLFVGVNIVVTQTIELKKKFMGEWRHSSLAWTGLAAGALLAGGVSATIVLAFRRAAIPVPVLLVENDTVIGVPLVLSWKYDSREDSVVQFEVQGSTTKNFQEIYKTLFRSGRATRIGSVNKKLYWRVRAVNEKKVALGNWSQPVKITQYDDALKRIQDTGKVTVYVSNGLDQGFFEFEDDNGAPKGYDLAVIQHIVDRLSDRLKIGTSLNYLAVDWQSLLDAPKKGRADIIVSAITARSTREDNHGIKFSEPYYCTTQSLLFRTGTLRGKIAKAIENKRVGVVSKTTSEEMIRSFAKVIVRPYDDGEQMISDVAKGEVDFAMIDTPLAKGAELQYGSERLNFRELIDDEDFPKDVSQERRQEKYAVAVRSGEGPLIDAINEIIKEMRPQMLRAFLQDAAAEFYKTRKEQGGPPDGRLDPSRCGSS